ncbi:MAG: putative transcriptional regulator [Cocleimonas sp.]|jgi:predicted transcriptional regulator
MRRQSQTKDEWENTVAAQQVSGLKASEYCAKHKIRYSLRFLRGITLFYFN